MLKITELRELTADELRQKRRDLEDELFNLNMRRSLKALDNPLRLRTLRRDMARIKTVLHEDELGIRALAAAKTSILSESKATRNEKAEQE